MSFLAKPAKGDLHFIRTGRMFGYPSCCIEAFLERCRLLKLVGKRDPHPLQRRFAARTGFIPCMAHAEFLTELEEELQFPTQDQLVRLILVNRTYPLPFPHCHALAATTLNPNFKFPVDEVCPPFMGEAVHAYGMIGRGEISGRAAFRLLDPEARDFLHRLLYHPAHVEKKVPGSDRRRIQARIAVVAERIKRRLVGGVGIEPTASGFGVRHSPN